MKKKDVADKCVTGHSGRDHGNWKVGMQSNIPTIISAFKTATVILVPLIIGYHQLSVFLWYYQWNKKQVRWCFTWGNNKCLYSFRQRTGQVAREEVFYWGFLRTGGCIHLHIVVEWSLSACWPLDNHGSPAVSCLVLMFYVIWCSKVAKAGLVLAFSTKHISNVEFLTNCTSVNWVSLLDALKKSHTSIVCRLCLQLIEWKHHWSNHLCSARSAADCRQHGLLLQTRHVV